MGRGVALQAKQRWPQLPRILGESIQKSDNHVAYLLWPDEALLLLSFPTKHHWRDDADLELIARSCGELIILADRLNLEHILLPRPGTGNGRLDWTQVRPVIAPILDDRVSVLYYDR